MRPTAEGKKELLALVDGYQESEQSWLEFLLDLRRARGLELDPELAMGDGALGFWKALSKAFPKTPRQRCWVHKTANVLNKLPKSLQAKAKSMLHDIWMAATRPDAEAAFHRFCETSAPSTPRRFLASKTTAWSGLPSMTFPDEHWIRLLTTNPIESIFTTVRLRTHKT